MQLSPQQQALVTLATLRPAGGGSGFKRANDARPVLTDEEDIGQIESLGAAGVGAETMAPSERLTRWNDRLPDVDVAGAASKLSELGRTESAAPRTINPRVSIATAMAAAADKSRSGTSLEDQYRRRGLKVSTEGDSIEDLGKNMKHNLLVRMSQGDSGAANQLLRMHPGESLMDIAQGTTRAEMMQRAMMDEGEERRYMREMAEQRRRDAIEQANADRSHQMALLGMRNQGDMARLDKTLGMEDKRLQAEQLHRANELKIRQRQVDGEISRGEADALYRANDLAFRKDEAEKNRTLQREMMGRDKDNDPLEGQIVGGVAAKAFETGDDPVSAALNARARFRGGQPAPVDPNQMASPQSVAKTMAELGYADTRAAFRDAMKDAIVNKGLSPSGINIQMPWQNEVTGRPVFRDQSPINNPEFKRSIADQLVQTLKFRGFSESQARRIVAEHVDRTNVY